MRIGKYSTDADRCPASIDDSGEENVDEEESEIYRAECA
jgi:hypothetical protein